MLVLQKPERFIWFKVLKIQQQHGASICSALVRPSQLHHHTADGVRVGVHSKERSHGETEATEIQGSGLLFL